MSSDLGLVEYRDWTPEQIAGFAGDDPSTLNPNVGRP